MHTNVVCKRAISLEVCFHTYCVRYSIFMGFSIEVEMPLPAIYVIIIANILCITIYLCSILSLYIIYTKQGGVPRDYT